MTVNNGSRASIQIQSLSFSSPQFTYTGPALPVTLDAGKSFSGSIQFLPTAAQKYSARLTFSAKQFSYGSTTVTLSGTGTATAPAPKVTPVISWTAPAAINYGTTLSAAQLDATANAAGSFVYSPALGTVLGAGSRALSVRFTPTNTAAYNMATGSVAWR